MKGISPSVRRPVALLVLAVVLSGCSPQDEIPVAFQGNFVSDRAKTEHYLRGDSGIAKPVVDQMVPILGQMELMVDGRSVTVYPRGSAPVKSTPTILEKAPKVLVVEEYHETFKRNLTTRMIADESGFWSMADYPVPGYREYFRRIK
jgi:hypothetical protein